MKTKTQDLIGPALDWAVAKAKGYGDFVLDAKRFREMHETGHHNYSTDWSQGGPIIERENLQVGPIPDIEGWYAYKVWGDMGDYTGPTALIAAMRAYVASQLGDTVDVPEELQ